MEDYFNCENKQEMQNIISEENQILKFIDCLNLNSLIIYYFLFEKFIPYIFVFILITIESILTLIKIKFHRIVFFLGSKILFLFFLN